MNLKINYSFLLLVLLYISTNVNAQIEEKNPTSDFIYEGNYFVPGSPWLIVGAGYGKNFSENMGEPNFMFDFHYQFDKKKQCVGFGYLTSRDKFRDTESESVFLPQSMVRHSTNSLYGTYGIRFERMHHNFATFVGPAFNWGYRYSFLNASGNETHIPFRELGLYANIQYSFKLFYDVGIGTSIWGSYCQSYQVIGFSVHLYLSSAFKRKVI